MKSLLISALCCATAPGMVLAQATPATSTLLHGNRDNGFLFAPDFKFTEVGGRFGTMVGGYGGWAIDRKLLFGAGVYTLAGGGSGTDMTYGGGVIEYFVNEGSLVNVSVRGLIGGGSATLSPSSFRFESLSGIDFGAGFRGFQVDDVVDGVLRRVSDRFDPDDGFEFSVFDESVSFFVAEPEVNVIVNITERIRFSVGGGYRFIGGAGRLSDRLDGFTATVALKLSFF